MTETIVIPNECFFESLIEELKDHKRVSLLIKGSSMFPFLRDMRDVVVLRALEEDEVPVNGSVCLFRYNNRFVLHRLVSMKDSSYIFRGDGNVKGLEIVTRDEIYAVMEKKISPSGEEWSCDSKSWKRLSAIWPQDYLFRRLTLAVLRRTLR